MKYIVIKSLSYTNLGAKRLKCQASVNLLRVQQLWSKIHNPLLTLTAYRGVLSCCWTTVLLLECCCSYALVKTPGIGLPLRTTFVASGQLLHVPVEKCI